ncbi:Pyruvate/Phosphoenolpyruvate kinase-like domain-containing protein [Leucosporidium creatinivorum]|uniref:Pyruvate/Phosphoenolpyruvate kinase-like domain-containing protein n=1 Tax=Leucosporidium creatinivorum TaxID=106004 RepID=A0A1Y2DDT4_9BASI|nr:Pyruvate/Phosphoenolpyruvate kinase-like domain-containing protein [Leucosporidium creatinivorum]
MSYGTHTVARNGTEERLGLWPALQKARPAEGAVRKPVVGSWQMLPGASLSRMTAQMGYDFVLVDCEHGNLADADMHASVGAVSAAGSSPIVRIPAPENWMVKRALDAGAHGLLCPMMGTAEEARRFVSYCKFPVPKAKLAKDPSLISGIRGVGSPFAPQVFGQSLPDYIASSNRNTFVGVQIETVEGVENCEEIAKVDGIDLLFVGPNDLASSMGYPATEHASIPEVQEAIARVLAACKAAGKFAGMFCTSAEQVQARFEQGFDIMNLGADVVAIGAWNAAELGKLSKIM